MKQELLLESIKQ